MDDFTKKSLVTSRGMTYTYYMLSSSKSKPALLLQHGFPDDHDIWHKVIPYFQDLGHTIIAPDLLGYGGTSKPSDPQEYNSKAMALDLIDILDKEQYKHAISIGHDYGCFMASRMTLWHPDRIVGMILLNVTYIIPGEIDVDKGNEFMIKNTGLPRLAYQKFFISPGAGELIESRLEAMFHAVYGSDEGTKNFMEDMLCHYGALEDFLRKDKRWPLKEYAKDPAFKDAWMTRMQHDGFEAPLNWYRASHTGQHWAVEKELPKERHRLICPVLFIGCTRDPVCLTQAIYVPQKAGLLPDLTIEEIESGHWQTLEAPEKCGPILAAWLKDRAADFTPKL